MRIFSVARLRSFFVTTICAALAGLFFLLPEASAQVTGVSYSLSPTGEYHFFERDRDAGLGDGYFYGGALGLGFGRYLEVSGEYMFSDDLVVDFAEPDDGDAQLEALAELPPRNVNLRRYGGQLRVNLGAGMLTPFLTAGSGILRFDPEGMETSENIYAILGGGIVYRPDNRFTVTVSGHQMAYRYNPGTVFYTSEELAEVGFPGGVEQRTVTSPTLRASLALHLGGRQPGQLSEVDQALLEQFGRGGGLRLMVEPFYGRIEFNEALGFPRDQNVAGANLGVQLGPQVGLRGFYWRGATGAEGPFDEFAEGFENIALYGGELKLRFSSARAQQGITPYGILGGGYLNVLGGYEDDIPPGTLPPDDRYFATLGGGLEVPLSPNFRLHGGVRSLFMSTVDELDVATPENVFGSLMYSAGIQFSLGGRGPQAPGRFIEEELAPDEERVAETEAQIARMQAQIDSLERVIAMQTEALERGEIPPEMRRQMEGVERPPTPGEPAPRRPARASNLSGETITLPVPEVGEIYIRFGELDGDVQVETSGEAAEAMQGLSQQEIEELVRQAVRGEDQVAAQGALTAEQVRQIVQETLREEVQQAEASMADLNMRQLEERLVQQERQRRALEREVTELRQQLVQERRATGTASDVVVETEEGRTVVRERRRSRGIFGGRQLAAVSPFTGVRFGEGPSQLMLAVRGDFRRPGGWLRLVPEAGVGVGGGRSVSAFGNVVMPFGFRMGPVEPYAGAGVGFLTNDGLSGFRFGLNLMGGVEYPMAVGSAFAEISTINIFATNRLLVGYRLQF